MKHFIIFVRRFIDGLLNHTNHSIDAENTSMFNGMPVGLQLLGRMQEEEAVIAMTEIVVEALNSRQ
jgi:amidase